MAWPRNLAISADRGISPASAGLFLNTRVAPASRNSGTLTTVSVSLTSESVTGLSFYKGESYRIGQVGSFVRIPLGYTSLFGIVSQVGAGAAPKTENDLRP